jgi:hypothetical protein
MCPLPSLVSHRLSRFWLASLILLIAALLNYIVAIYLIIAGVVSLNEIHHFLK